MGKTLKVCAAERGGMRVERVWLLFVALSIILVACSGRVTESKSFVDREANVGLDKTKQAPIVPEWSTVSSGEFTGVGHTGEGTARILQNGGLRMLEFSDFSTDRGPDLKVVLSKDGSLEDAVIIGKLEAFSGYQSYGVPGFVDTNQYRYVLIWCEEFNVLFASAELS